MHDDAERLIADLRLAPHPEGGYYRETFRNAERVTTSRGTTRSALTCIYYLLSSEAFSAFHVIASDEVWHFYRGSSLTLEIIAPAGTHETRTLGPQGPWQSTVAAGAHFAAHVDGDDSYALVGCDVAPGFEFSDFRLTTRSMLVAAYPQHAPLIARYTRSPNP